MFEKKFCIECSRPKNMLRFKCKKCKRMVCLDCVIELDGGAHGYCIFCAEDIIHNRIKRTANKKAVCLHCGERIKDAKFTHCPYCGKGLKQTGGKWREKNAG